MEPAKLTIITPTIGKPSLRNLVETIASQKISVNHILLWDNIRDNSPNSITLSKAEEWRKDLAPSNYKLVNIYINDKIISPEAPGSALRSIGLMAATTEWVTFADDDIMWEHNHIESMFNSISGQNWAYCKRIIWTKNPDDAFELIGIDNFESIGEESKLEYKMVDNNSLFFKRRFGSSAAVLYRETKEYNDDKLMYSFLIEHAGLPAKTNLATINQVCPTKLVDFFKTNCTII